ncbi:hypothetical protein GpartN1_g2550.t1 [Galdieria partita]|uniref:Uncharacterized protein n=1 Tax=Galdieria partita TaxID=83374 RepID=A0A9C7PV25_9RHOD|nr:hypothetical protein GpartN1_g2550.t1 [Galdieria partita]
MSTAIPNNNSKDCGTLLKTFSECVEKQVGCSSQLKAYIRCEQRSFRLRWEKRNHPTDANNRKRKVTLKHYDNFGTIVNEPTELRKQEEDNNKQEKKEEPSKQKPIEPKTKSHSSYQQRWGTYEPMNDGLPLIDFWKSYWNNGRRLLTVMLDGRYIRRTERFGRKMYRHMEKEWEYVQETLRTVRSSWKSRKA